MWLPSRRQASTRHSIDQPALVALDRVGLFNQLENNHNLLSGALHSHTTTELLSLCANLHAQGITILLVTHENDEGARADRVVHFHHGRIRD